MAKAQNSSDLATTLDVFGTHVSYAKGQCLTEDLHFFPPQRLQQTIARLNSPARTPKPTMQEMVRDWIDRAKTWLFN